MSNFNRNWRKVVRVGDVFHDDDLTFEAKRDACVARLNRIRAWAERVADEYPDESPTLPELIDDLADADDADEFNERLDAIYDWGDIDKRLFFDTFTMVQVAS